MSNKALGIVGSICFLLILVIGINFQLWWGLIALGGLILLAGGVFCFIYFFLAPNDYFWTFIEDGTIKTIVKGTTFDHFLIAWEGKVFEIQMREHKDDPEANWEIVEGNKRKPMFGLYWVGIWPINAVLLMRVQFNHMHPDGKIKYHDETQDFLVAKIDNYVFDYSLKDETPAEDMNGIPLGATMIIPMGIGNPYIARFRYTQSFATISAAAKAATRTFLAKYRYKEDLLAMKAGKGIEDLQAERGIPVGERAKEGEDLRKKLWEEFVRVISLKASEQNEAFVEEEGTIKAFGWAIHRKGADLINFDPDKNYRDLTTLAYRTQKEGERSVIQSQFRIKVAEQNLQTAEINKKIKTLETGGVLAGVAEMLENKGASGEEARSTAKEVVEYFKGADTGTLRHIKIDDGKGGDLGDFAKVAGVIDAMRSGGSEDSGNKKGKGEQASKNSDKENLEKNKEDSSSEE
jgi:hypothetical protein